MVFWIMIGCIVMAGIVNLSVNLMQQKDIGETVGDALATMFITTCIAALALIFFMPATTAHNGERIEESVKTYTIAPGSEVSFDGSKIYFVSEDNGKLQPIENSSDVTRFTGTERKTVQITKVRWEHGNWLFPWGSSASETTIVVK